jgi:hypothetical protein
MTEEVADYPLLNGLQSTLAAHGLNTIHRAGWLHPPLGPAFSAHLEQSSASERGVGVILSISLALEDGRMLCEAFAGRGSDLRSAVADAFQKFLTNSLHVLLAAFYGIVDESQISVEAFEKDGAVWQLFAGPFGIARLGSNQEAAPPNDLFDRLVAAARDTTLPRSVHWFRTFRGQLDGKVLGSESLCDNDAWPQASDAIGSIAWPRVSGYYSLRNFFIVKRNTSIEPMPLHDGEALAMAVELAIAAWRDESIDDLALYNRLITRGVGPDLAERVLAFVPLGFSKFVLAGANLPEEYQVSTPGQAVANAHRLIDEPVFVLARHRARRSNDAELSAVANRCAFMAALRQVGAHEAATLDASDLANIQFTVPLIVRPRFRPPTANESEKA